MAKNRGDAAIAVKGERKSHFDRKEGKSFM